MESPKSQEDEQWSHVDSSFLEQDSPSFQSICHSGMVFGLLGMPESDQWDGSRGVLLESQGWMRIGGPTGFMGGPAGAMGSRGVSISSGSPSASQDLIPLPATGPPSSGGAEIPAGTPPPATPWER